MSTTITQKFVNAFDPLQKKHVVWLGKFFEYSKNIAETKVQANDFMDTNPFGIKFTKDEYLEYVHIHFVLAMKYSQAVLEKKAWVPT